MSSIPSLWAAKIRQWIQNAAARFDIIATSGDDGQYEIEGSDDDGNAWQDPARLYQHYGHRSRPGARIESITVPCRGAQSQRAIIATRSKADEPPELKDWEADVYGKFGQRMHLREDGTLAIDSRPLSDPRGPTDVVVNGGTKKVAREEDTVLCVASITGVYDTDGDLIGLNITDGDGNVMTITAATPGPFQITGKINAGAPHFKA